MPKQKDASGIPGYSIHNKSYLTTEKGFYLQGFTTSIKNVGQHELSKAEHYAIELVSRYSKIDKRLLHLNKISESHTMSTTTFVYQVTTGSMINGKIYITAQILSEKNINLMFNYRYRVDSKHYFEVQDTFDSHINHHNNTVGWADWKNSRWIRHRNKQENHRKKYKER